MSDIDLLAFEKKAYKNGLEIIAGVDEAGRGPLAGPVVAAACILPEGLIIDGVKDSKKLTPKKRRELFEEIKKNKYAVGIVDAEEIDKINILQATIKAMLIAVDKLDEIPDYLLVDGLKLPHPTIESEKIIKGDSLSHSIAAASIVAKETRDELMRDLHEEFPQYNFKQHKGYGTKEHMRAIMEHGPSPIHRFSFEPIKTEFAKC